MGFRSDNRWNMDFAMNWYESFEMLRFAIGFETMKIGVVGSRHFASQISIYDVCEYLDRLLYIPNNSHIDAIVSLLAAKDDEVTFKSILISLSDSENSNNDIEAMKWVIVLLNRRLQSLTSDYVENMLLLNDFWVTADLPDAPHIFQGVENEYTPSNYYTREVYDLLLARYGAWMDMQIHRINEYDSQHRIVRRD